MSARKIQLSKNGVNLYPQTIDQAIAVVAKSKLLSTVLAELGAEDERLAGLIAASEEKITVLNGTGEGSVDKKIADAIDTFATQVTDDDTINTVKELFDYVAEHGSDFNALLGRVSTNETNISGLQGQVSALESDNTTNKQNIAKNTEDITGLSNKVGSSADEASAEGSLYARIAQVKADLAALSGDGGTVSEQINSAIEENNTSVVTPIDNRVKAIEDDYLKAADKTEAMNAAQAAKDAADAAQEHSEGVASDLSDHIADTVKHITAAEREAWNAKIDYAEVGDTTYPDFNEIVTA